MQQPVRIAGGVVPHGGTVVADFYAASGSDGVVLAHDAAFDKASWAPFSSWLVDRGHQVLAIDIRGYGPSTAGTDAHALFEDVLAAMRYLHGRGVVRVAVLGASMGGGAAAEADLRAISSASSSCRPCR